MMFLLTHMSNMMMLCFPLLLESKMRKEAPQDTGPALNLSLATIDSFPSHEKGKAEDKKPASSPSDILVVDVTGSDKSTSLSGSESSDPEFDVKKEMF